MERAKRKFNIRAGIKTIRDWTGIYDYNKIGGVRITEDVVLEIEYYGDELTAVFRKGGHVYTYPLAEVEEIVNRLHDSGAEVIDYTVDGVYTVYSQEEDYDERRY